MDNDMAGVSREADPVSAATAVERLFPPDVIRNLDAMRASGRRLAWLCCRNCAGASR